MVQKDLLIHKVEHKECCVDPPSEIVTERDGRLGRHGSFHHKHGTRR
jgi:hypothetical protein